MNILEKFNTKLKKVKIDSFLIAISIFATITLFDLVLKIVAKNYIQDIGKVSIIKMIISFIYVENEGASWGILKGKRALLLITSFLALLIFGFLLTFVDLKKKKVYSASIIFLLSGTLGNALDRIMYGYVVDFINFDFINFPTFNFADIYLTFGIILLLIDTIILDTIKKKKNKNKINLLKKDIKHEEN